MEYKNGRPQVLTFVDNSFNENAYTENSRQLEIEVFLANSLRIGDGFLILI